MILWLSAMWSPHSGGPGFDSVFDPRIRILNRHARVLNVFFFLSRIPPKDFHQNAPVFIYLFLGADWTVWHWGSAQLGQCPMSRGDFLAREPVGESGEFEPRGNLSPLKVFCSLLKYAKAKQATHMGDMSHTLCYNLQYNVCSYMYIS